MELPAGRHVLNFQLAGYRSAVRILNVPQDQSASVRLEQQSGTLMVKTTPGGAAIILNGQTQTQQTPAVIKLPIGNYKLILRKEGLRDYEEDIQVKDGVISNITVNWDQ